MDETPLPQNDLDREAKEAIDKELANFLKPENGNNSKKPDTPVVQAQKPAEAATNSIQKPEIPNSKQPIIRTYKSDMEETIQSGHLSSINIAVSENNKLYQHTPTDIVDTAKKIKINMSVLIISGILIFGGALAFVVPYLVVNHESKTTTPSVNNEYLQNLIPIDAEETINIATLNLNRVAETLQDHVQQSSTALGQIKDIVLTQGSSTSEEPISAQEFLQLIGAHVPSDIQLTLEPSYMFGMHNFDGNQEFVILKVGEYATAFSGMLAWENYLWQDFSVLFNLQNPTQTTAIATTTASSSENISETNPEISPISSSVVTVQTFQDASFDNKDCRVVKDANGNIIFLYSIVDDNTIVITTNVNTLEEIISRLQEANVSTQ